MKVALKRGFIPSLFGYIDSKEDDIMEQRAESKYDNETLGLLMGELYWVRYVNEDILIVLCNENGDKVVVCSEDFILGAW